MPLRLTILLVITLTAAACLSIGAWTGLKALRDFGEREVHTRATVTAELLATAVQDAVLSKDLSRLEQLIADVFRQPGLVYIRVTDRDNNTLAERGPLPDHALAAGQPRNGAAEKLVETTAEIVRNGIRLGQAQLGLATSELQGPLGAARRQALYIIAAGSAAIALLALLLGHYLGRRINDLKSGLQRLAGGEFGFQLHWRGPHEMTRLAASFNQMSSQIKQLFNAQHEEENRKDAILNSALDCIITVDQQGLINEFNAAAAATFGYPRRQMLGKPARNLIAPVHRAAFAKSINPYPLSGQDPFIRHTSEISALRADQSVFPAELTISAMRVGEQPLVTLYLRDISERKQAESERQRLMLAVEASPDSIFITDTQGLIRYINPAFTTITGWTAAEIIGKPPGVLKSEQMATGFYADMWANLRQGKIWSGRILKRRKQPAVSLGHDLFWAQSTIAPIQGPKGELQGYVAVERDITEAVQREELEHYERESAELRARVAQILQSQQPLRQRFQEVLHCIVQISGLHLHNKGCVLLYREDTGLQEVFASHGDMDLQAFTKEQCLALQARLTEKPLAADEIIISNDSPFGLHTGYYAAPIQHGDKLLGFLLLLSESYPSTNSARLSMLRLLGEMMGLALANHRVQQEMEKARKAAEDAARTKSQFLANMSHEIRTPMYGVMGMLDLLRQQSLGSPQCQYVDTAHSSARLLLDIIDDILDFSRIEAGELRLEHIDFEAGQILESVCTLLAERAHRKHLELSCFVAASVPHTVRGDPGRLQQVLTNLVGNAIKFTDQGEVAVNVEIESEQTDQIYLRFQVKDTGIGIAPDAQKRLFRPFSQADGSTSRRYGGTGLGLVISKQLVELMGGTIGFDSTPKQGSTFWFTARFDHPTLSLPAHSDLAGIRILVVDDNVTSRSLLENYLERWGAVHDSAANGPEALAKLRRAAATGQTYQIAVIDQQMPDLDGIALVHAIRADTAVGEPRVVLLTSLTQTGGALNPSHCEAYLTKPVRQSYLYETLVKVIHGEAAQTSEIDLMASRSAAPLLQFQGRVLLVEDNEISQTVGLQLLKQLGLDADLANDGLQAIEAFERQPYDAILMDCQMPQMDGFQVTAAIRAREHNLGKPRTPIIALTANAMEGDREACLEAGMDGYLAKPFETQTLGKLLSKWLPVPVPELRATTHNKTQGSAISPPAAQAIEPEAAAIDRQKLRELHELLGSNFGYLVETFETSGNSLIKEMYKATASGDTGTLLSRAHHLKGSCSHIGAFELFELCRRLEEATRSGNTGDLFSQVNRIASAHQRACRELGTHI